MFPLCKRIGILQLWPWMDESGSAKASGLEAGLEMNPGDEGKILNSINDCATNYLKLCPAANTICLLVALKILQFQG